MAVRRHSGMLDPDSLSSSWIKRMVFLVSIKLSTWSSAETKKPPSTSSTEQVFHNKGCQLSRTIRHNSPTLLPSIRCQSRFSSQRRIELKHDPCPPPTGMTTSLMLIEFRVTMTPCRTIKVATMHHSWISMAICLMMTMCCLGIRIRIWEWARFPKQ